MKLVEWEVTSCLGIGEAPCQHRDAVWSVLVQLLSHYNTRSSLEALHIHLDIYVSQVSSASKPSSGTLVSLAGLLGKEGAGQNIEMQHLRRGR